MAWLALSLLLSVSAKISMNPETRQFVDETGRSKIFHGFNAVFKAAPFTPEFDHFDGQMSISDEDIQNLADWGFNFIRLGVMWQSVETAPQVYNTTYLEVMNDLIYRMGAAGIYTLVDAHQDLFARQFCGEGVPDFYAANITATCDFTEFSKLLADKGVCKTMKSFDLEYDDQGFPTVESCLKYPFLSYYFTAEVAVAFANLYKNVNGIRDRFYDYWDVTTKYFADNQYVVGYDPINEPFFANFWEDPTLLFPGHFDNQVLQPIYKEYNNVVRKNTQDQIIFFEPTTFDLLPAFGGIVLDVGFTETPGGPQYNHAQVLNDHSYCCAAGTETCKTGEPTLDEKDLCRSFNTRKIGRRSGDAKKLNVGLIISEFGACSDSDGCMAEIDSVADACDEYSVGWAYWMLKGFGDYTTTGSYTEGLYNQDGSLQEKKLRHLSRTYIQSYQGVPITSTFNTTTGDYKAAFEVDPSIKGSTELYFNEPIYYPNGYQYTITNETDLKYEVVAETNKLIITFSEGKKSKTVVEFFAK
mmetsp:Transcript_18571/g.33555  ORF Transcript_18571/g.33555 Transcript_18571/m.33555 type:complete len:527 (-) Transcript_18571:22-1602(-)